MLVPSWAKSAVGVVLAIAVPMGALAWHDHDVAQRAVQAAQLAQSDSIAKAANVRAMTWQAREAVQHARADSLQRVARTQTQMIDSLARRVTIVRPGVIRVESGAPVTKGTGSGGDAVPRPAHPPAVTVTVPPIVTDFMQAQAAELATLTAQVATADSGWAAADSVNAARKKQIAALNTQITALRSQHSRFGLKTGVALGVLGTLGAAWAFGRFN